MSLEDRTNETIPLSLHVGPENEIVVDHDFDSSFEVPHRVHVYSNVDGQDFGFNMTFEEAGKLHDRLGLILGRATPASTYAEIRSRISQEDFPIHLAADVEQIICETGNDFGDEEPQ